MTAPSALEKRLNTLIAQYRGLKSKQQNLLAKITQQHQQITDLQARCDGLRKQIDTLDRQRFTLKKMKDERKMIRSKLEKALERLAAIEGELNP